MQLPEWRQKAAAVKWQGSYASESEDRSVAWYEVVSKYAYFREEPSVESTLLGLMPQGGLLEAYAASQEVKDEKGNTWIELTKWTKWRKNIHSDRPRAFTLIDATAFGEGLQLQSIPFDRWPKPDLPEMAGLRWNWQSDSSFRPPAKNRSTYLCWWNPDPDAVDQAVALDIERPLPPPALDKSSQEDPQRNQASCQLPVLGVCCLLKGAPPSSVESWLLYHSEIGFSKLYLFFDDPNDAAIAVARHVADLLGLALTIYECSPTWWSQALHRSRYYQNRKEIWAKPVIEMHEKYKDVQCRQQLCVDIAIQEAARDNVDWLLHVDIDELLYFPPSEFRSDAAKWFSTVPPNVSLVKFHNHECVPESFEVGDWFREVTLFKMNERFLAQADDPLDWKVWADNTPFQSDSENDVDELDIKHAEEEIAKEIQELNSRKANASTEKPARCKPKEIACHQAYFSIKLARSKHMAKLGLRLPETPWDRRCRKFHEMLKAKRLEMKLPEEGIGLAGTTKNNYKFAETFTHFNGYTNGKCAVRLRQSDLSLSQAGFGHSLPIALGVHTFMGLCRQPNQRLVPMILRKMRMDGPESPVVLHYANCGFSHWVKKYKTLGNFPDEMNGQQNTMRPHLASRDLVARNDVEQQECFYRLFCLNNMIGELPLLFSQGLVVRVDGARQIVEKARRCYRL